jgi:hypothetical protein
MLLALVLEGGMVKMLNCLGRPRDGGCEPEVKNAFALIFPGGQWHPKLPVLVPKGVRGKIWYQKRWLVA